jgi:hypothetical protein
LPLAEQSTRLVVQHLLVVYLLVGAVKQTDQVALVAVVVVV